MMIVEHQQLHMRILQEVKREKCNLVKKKKKTGRIGSMLVLLGQLPPLTYYFHSMLLDIFRFISIKN